jgi:hypothetical protein
MHLALFLLQTSATPEQIQQAEKMLAVILPMIGIFMLVGVAIVVIPCWFICKKAGFSPWLSLLNIVPIGNLILLYILAFADWKVAPIPQQAWASPPYPPQPPFPPPPPPPYSPGS